MVTKTRTTVITELLITMDDAERMLLASYLAPRVDSECGDSDLYHMLHSIYLALSKKGEKQNDRKNSPVDAMPCDDLFDPAI